MPLAEIRYLCMEHWASARDEWVTVADAGTRPEQAVRAPLLVRRMNWLRIALLAILNVVMGFFLYFVPGMQLSPASGHSHDLGYTLGILALADVVAITMFAWSSKRT